MTRPGAQLIEGGCEFCVWAPLATIVAVAIEGSTSTPRPMNRDAEGFFTGVVPDVKAGSRYRFMFDDGKAIPDPCSRFQPDGPHGPSMVIDNDAYEWHDANWTGLSLAGQVLYELHIGTFTPEGTFDAAASKLEYLVDLGVTAVEIMPIAECPGLRNWGYDGVMLFAPSHHYGDFDGLKRFVDRAHSLGVGVILDVVYNHLGPDGNYLPTCSPYYFTDRYNTDWGPALNFDGEHSAPVREFVLANACTWVRDFHLDGLRLDATQSIFDSGSRHILGELAERVREAAAPRRILLISENEPQHASHLLPIEEGGLDLDAMWNDDFHHSAMVAATGRRHAYYHDYLGRAQEFVATAKRGFLYQGQYYRWQKQPRGEPLERHVSACVAFLQNHDQVANSLTGARLHHLAGPSLCRALTALLLLGPQTPMLFMGQEFNAESPFLFFADHQEPLRSQVLSGRKQFLEQFPGAASPASQEAVLDPASDLAFQSSILDWSQCREENTALRLHKDLLAIRRTDAVIAGQGVNGFDGAALNNQVLILRWFDAERGDRLLVVNLGKDIPPESAPEPLLACRRGHRWSVAWSSEDVRYAGSGGVNPDSPEGWLFPAESAVLLRALPKEPPA